MVFIKPTFALLALSTLAFSAPLRREVPQEHSHEPIITKVRQSLNVNNPDKISDPIFSLLGNAAAAAGAGNIKNLDCLQQAVADQAFTNAKAAGDTAGMVNALIFRALERNTGKVGLASVLCTETAKNPEVAAIQQHQDPASAGAAAHNKAVVLALAKEIAKVGGNPQDALKSGTFAPGNLNDNTGKGKSCDVANDPNGCIFTQNLLVPDATAAEINQAVAGITGGNNGNAASTGTGNAASTGNANKGNGKKGTGKKGAGKKGNGAAASNNNSSGSCAVGQTPTTVTVTVTAAPTATAA